MSRSQRRLPVPDDEFDATCIDDGTINEPESDASFESDNDRHHVGPRKKQRLGVAKQTKTTTTKSKGIVEAERAPRNRIRKFYRSDKKHNFFTAAW
jgi:hypothetical protein